MATIPFAATRRDKDTTSTELARRKWAGSNAHPAFHVAHPVVKLADGNYFVGEHRDETRQGVRV